LRALSLLLAIAGLAVVAPASAADGESCQGKPATIVQKNGLVEGTDGDDVIIGGRDTVVRARGGDDVICVRGGDVSGGAGGEIDRVQVRGTGADDVVRVRNVADVRARLGAGDDRLVVRLDKDYPIGGRIDMGEGRDELVLRFPSALILDLEDDYFTVFSVFGNVSLKRLEDVDAVARSSAIVSGDEQNNRLRVTSCSAQVSGGRGNDVLSVAKPSACDRPRRPTYAYGQRGDDVLRGAAGSDVLVGGPGRDSADGRAGRDSCDAEVLISCER